MSPTKSNLAPPTSPQKPDGRRSWFFGKKKKQDDNITNVSTPKKGRKETVSSASKSPAKQTRASSSRDFE